MALANVQGTLVIPDAVQHAAELNQALGMGRQTLQQAVNLIVRHDQAFDWSAIRAQATAKQGKASRA